MKLVLKEVSVFVAGLGNVYNDCIRSGEFCNMKLSPEFFMLTHADLLHQNGNRDLLLCQKNLLLFA
jgi:hypothetical protein